MKINEVVKNLEEEPKRKRHAYPDATPVPEPEPEPELDIDDQSWVDVARAWVDRVKHAPRARPQTSFIQGAKNAFSWPKAGFSKEQLKNIKAYKKYGDGTKAQKLRYAKAGGRDPYYGEGAKK